MAESDRCHKNPIVTDCGDPAAISVVVGDDLLKQNAFSRLPCPHTWLVRLVKESANQQAHRSGLNILRQICNPMTILHRHRTERDKKPTTMCGITQLPEHRHNRHPYNPQMKIPMYGIHRSNAHLHLHLCSPWRSAQQHGKHWQLDGTCDAASWQQICRLAAGRSRLASGVAAVFPFHLNSTALPKCKG